MLYQSNFNYKLIMRVGNSVFNTDIWCFDKESLWGIIYTVINILYMHSSDDEYMKQVTSVCNLYLERELNIISIISII